LRSVDFEGCWGPGSRKAVPRYLSPQPERDGGADAEEKKADSGEVVQRASEGERFSVRNHPQHSMLCEDSPEFMKEIGCGSNND
jgi:hypothetical protein